MGNSTIRLQEICDYARTYPDLNPILSTGGFSQQPALTIANDVLIAMLSRPFAPKWNRIRLPYFYTNSWQQDYAFASPALLNLSWLEYGVLMDVNSTSSPKDKYTLETNRDLPETNVQYGRPGQVNWLPNDQLVYGTWGGGNTLGESQATNPGPGSVYGALLGVTAQPANPFLQIQDQVYGNYWVLTNALTAGCTLGATMPNWPATVQYPTLTNPAVAATTIADGTGIWTAVNPKGQGLRLNPIPSQQGKVWQCRVFGQARAPQFTSLSQTIDPVPDDFAAYFRRGFIAYSFMHSKDLKVRAKFQDQQALWMQSLQVLVSSQDRERDNAGIYPTDSIMPSPGSTYLGPANPYYPGGY
jgi:hypothetical protein